jgi:ATP-dependent DNA helicase RecG
MNRAELQRRLHKWEDLHTEFKEWPVQADDLAASLIAFATTDGGQLILGVAEDRRIHGVADADAVMQKVDQVAYQNCEPPLVIVQETVAAESGAVVVVVNVPKGDQRPYRTSRGVHYIRTTSGRRRASRQELLRLFQAAESLFYDETTLTAATLADLDLPLFDRLTQTAYPGAASARGMGHERLLLNLRLAREVDGAVHPTVTALLFFGREPQVFLPQAHIVAARLPGSDLAAPPSDSKRLDGTLLAILENAVRFLDIHLLTRHRIQGFEPETFPELPKEALREVLVNALAHRDYTVMAPIRLFVFDDRVDVRTPGGLPNTVTIEAMKLSAVHVLRNPSIYLLFDRLGMVTGIGSGVYRTIQLVRQATGREPDLYLEGNEMVVSLPRVRG